MVRIHIEAPALAEPQEIDLARGETVTVGREPEAASDDAARSIAIASPSVSASHLVVSHDDDVHLEDLGSRNGSWLRLPPRVRVSVADTPSLTVRLAVAPERDEDDGDPPDAAWDAPTAFRHSLADVARTWLLRRGVHAEVTLRPGTPDVERDSPSELPLADGAKLSIVPRGTLDNRWPRTLQQLWRWVERQNGVYRSEQLARSDGLILASRAIRAAHRSVMEAAQRGLRVLLIGPSGSGKEGLARCYHRHTARKGGFVALNCAMFSRDLLRAELFGVERHAFTGVERTTGAVERAHRGTLFLDEVGELTEDVQPMLLRFLDHGEYTRMGSYGQPLAADVRIVAATNRDLKRATADGRFREDLWYRLSIIVVEVPPLTERLEDVSAFLDSYQVTPGLSATAALSDGALEILLAHRWDGNFRELANFAERLPRVTRTGAIDADQCRHALQQGAVAPLPARAQEVVPLDSGALDWPALAGEALRAFSHDAGAAPASWRDIQKYLEKYVKPLSFAQLSGAAALPSLEEALARASRLGADRGTVRNQLRQFFARFRDGSPVAE